MAGPVSDTCSEDRPCGPCPWVSTDARDREAVAAPAVQKAMQEGGWFACHVNLGTCHGARLQHEKHLRKTGAVTP